MEKIVKSVSELLKCMSRDVPRDQPCWFRGQSQSRWKLLPALARKKRALNAEVDLIVRFRQNATLLLGNSPRSEWDWLTIMQHHGAPTRLLDWTESPLIALYFAVSEKLQADGALWALLPCSLNQKSNIRPDYPHYIPTFEDEVASNYTPSALAREKTSRLRPIAVIAPRNTPRMLAQLGVFTVTHRDSLPIEEIESGEHAWKYLIPKKRKQHILAELFLLGVGEFQLFPELERIGRGIRGKIR